MTFHSPLFLLIFLPLTWAGFFAIGRFSPRMAALWLGIASLVFYGAGGPILHVGVLLASIAFNFSLGTLIARGHGHASLYRQRILLIIGISGNLSLLGYFKYASFLLESFGFQDSWIDTLLPLGISFFTFTQIAYLADAYQGRAQEYDPVHYLLFVTYFPHLIAGPILHHAEMMPQFARPWIYRIRARDLSIGLSIFTVGLVKKVVIADGILAPFTDRVFALAHMGGDLSWFEAWIGALGFTLQIYFDFSAYSDMAIGLSRMIGIRLPLNFNSPYKARNIIDFWRRWHMTLSRFLRDYLYIPLGGNRRGMMRRYVNLAVVMLLGGLWHGASWTFVLWGAIHGLYLMVAHAWRSAMPAMSRWLGCCLTFIAVVIAWVPFRAETGSAAWSFLNVMLGGEGLSLPVSIEPWLGSFTDGMAWIRFDGMLRNRLIPVEEVFPALTILLVLCWLAPNTQEIFRSFGPALGKIDARPRFLAWRPTMGQAIVFGVILTFSFLFSLGHDETFIYFRF